jgi:hypothetical protein
MISLKNSWTRIEGEPMISLDCDFEKFVREIRGKDYYDVIYLAEKEATQAWRRSYNNQTRNCASEDSRNYQEKLIGLIDYLRHGLKASILDDEDLYLCSELQKECAQPRRSVAPDGYSSLTLQKWKGAFPAQ